MALPAILTTAISIGTQLYQSSNNGSSQPAFVRCEGQPSDEAVQYMLDRVPQTSLAELKAMAQRLGLGPDKFTTPYQIAYESYGGNNCNWWASDQTKALKQKFDMLMATWGPPNLGGGTYAASTVQASQASGPTVGSVATGIGQNILDYGKNILTGAATGAAQGATAASQAGATASGMAATTQLLMPILLLGAGIAVVVLMRRGR